MVDDIFIPEETASLKIKTSIFLHASKCVLSCGATFFSMLSFVLFVIVFCQLVYLYCKGTNEINKL